MNDIHKSPKTNKGFIYILSNASMPNIFKVGLTTNSVKQRIQELNSTGVPTAFELVKKYEIQESYLQIVERLAHKKLKSKEQHHGKEFFNGPLKSIEAAVEDAIFEKTGEVAIELVGSAIKRKKDEEEFKQKVKERQYLENQLTDQQRLNYITSTKKTRKESESFLDKYVYGPIGFICIAGFAIALLFAGAIGWLIAAGLLWYFYAEYTKPEKDLIEQSEKIFPYKSTEEIEHLVRSGKEFQSTYINESNYGSTTTTIIMCKCSQRLRIPLGKHIDVTCPKCRRSFRIAT
jgi:hypothetical protein